MTAVNLTLRKAILKALTAHPEGLDSRGIKRAIRETGRAFNLDGVPSSCVFLRRSGLVAYDGAVWRKVEGQESSRVLAYHAMLRPDEIEAIRAWVPIGMSAYQIALLLKRSHQTVRGAARELGILWPEREELDRIKQARAIARTRAGLKSENNFKGGIQPHIEGPLFSRARREALYNGRTYQDDPVEASRRYPILRTTIHYGHHGLGRSSLGDI